MLLYFFTKFIKKHQNVVLYSNHILLFDQPYFFCQPTVFFSYDKLANSSFNHDFSDNQPTVISAMTFHTSEQSCLDVNMQMVRIDHLIFFLSCCFLY